MKNIKTKLVQILNIYELVENLFLTRIDDDYNNQFSAVILKLELAEAWINLVLDDYLYKDLAVEHHDRITWIIVNGVQLTFAEKIDLLLNQLHLIIKDFESTDFMPMLNQPEYLKSQKGNIYSNLYEAYFILKQLDHGF